MVLKVALNTTTPDFSYFRKSDVFLRVKGKWSDPSHFDSDYK